MNKPVMATPKFNHFDDSVKFMNLNTKLNEYHAHKGSTTVFDFSHGNPLVNLATDYHKDAGAHLKFTGGSTGKQELGVTSKFVAGSQKRLDKTSATGPNAWKGKSTAMDNHFATMKDHYKAAGHNNQDVWGLVLLQI